MGYWTAKYFAQEGAKIIGIVEHHSAIYNSQGFQVDDVKLFFMRNGTLFGYPKSEEEDSIDPMQMMEYPCDILIPAAIEKSITKHNADRLKCKLIIEGANGPTTYFAEELLL